MFSQQKNRLERELKDFCGRIDKAYGLKRISPFLCRHLREYILRDGKRVRPLLFLTGYLGYSSKAPRGLYTSAIAIELLHDFMLIHDDIIDKSSTRRGLPSLHTVFDSRLAKAESDLKFNGSDMALVAGDVLYAMAIHAFLEVKADPRRKEAALRKFIEAALYTGCGEFIELINDTQRLATVTLKDIYRVYDYKTAHYTFACPLACGAILAGARPRQTKAIFDYGLLIGRAFQIKDDIIGIFGEEKDSGKSPLTDLREGKKTVLIWHAYNKADDNNKQAIARLLSGKNADWPQLAKLRSLLDKYGSRDYAANQITGLLEKSLNRLNAAGLKEKYRRKLETYSRQIAGIP